MVKRLSEEEWQPFRVFAQGGDFDIHTTSSSIDGIRLLDGPVKDVPYVTRTDVGNGIARFVSDRNFAFGFDGGGCITAGLDTQTAFYQPHKFVTGQNVQVITGKHINEETAQFLVPLFKSQMRAKFNWGGNGATLGRMKKLEMMLPVDENSKPDYAYMASYANETRRGLLTRYKSFLDGRIRGLKHVDVPALDEKEWQPVQLSQYFDFKRGRESNMATLGDGDTPLVSAKSVNNGVKAFVSTHRNTVEGDCISLNNDGDGGAGLAYYQPAEMALDTHVTALIPKQPMSSYAMLFIARCISGLHGFFGHGLSISTPRAKRVKVMLPVENGGPDFAYMEQYAMNMMLSKYRQYLVFLDQHARTNL